MNEELKNLLILRTILMSSSIELKGDAVVKIASSLVWLDAKIEALKENKDGN